MQFLTILVPGRQLGDGRALAGILLRGGLARDRPPGFGGRSKAKTNLIILLEKSSQTGNRGG
jgi:hypothetical protein